MTAKLRLFGDRGLNKVPTWQHRLVNYLASRAESTRKTYQVDWNDLVRWSPYSDLPTLLKELFDGEPMELLVRVPAVYLDYQTDLLTRPVWDRVADREAGKPASRQGLALATVARRLKAFKALVGVAKMSGACPEITLPSPPTVEAVRDRAILRLLHDCALRRIEIIRLERGDIADDLQSMRVWGKGKDKSRKKQLPLADKPGNAVAEWLAIRGPGPGALFTKTTESVYPLSPSAVNKLVMRWGVAAGLLRATPHQLRHTAITTLGIKGATLMQMQAFARHANPATTQVYIDNLGEGVRKSQELLGDDDE